MFVFLRSDLGGDDLGLCLKETSLDSTADTLPLNCSIVLYQESKVSLKSRNQIISAWPILLRVGSSVIVASS